MLPEPVQRYQVQKVTAPFEVWRFDRRRQTVAGKDLRIEVFEPALVHWSSDQWHTTHDMETQDTGLGVHCLDLPAANLAPGTTILFTFRWRQSQRWEGTDFKVDVVALT